MRYIDLAGVQEPDGGASIPAGLYVVRILDVKDNIDKQRLEVIYDISEGEHALHYSDEWGKKNEWAHEDDVYYTDNAVGMFKGFLNRLEESNPNFSVEEWNKRCNEKELIGLCYGICLNYRLYIYNGEEKKKMTVRKRYAAQDIRNGDAKMLDVKDDRGKSSGKSAAATSAYDDDYTPF